MEFFFLEDLEMACAITRLPPFQFSGIIAAHNNCTEILAEFKLNLHPPLLTFTLLAL